VKIIRNWCTTFHLLLCVAHKTVWEKNGAILEFRLFPDISQLHKNCTGSTHATFSVVFVSEVNQLDAQKFCFTISLFHASTCFEHMCSSSGGQNCIIQHLVSSHRPVSQPVNGKVTYRCDDSRGCVMQFWAPDDEHMFSKHVQVWNKVIIKQKFCTSSWFITEIYILSCTVSKTSKFSVALRQGKCRLYYMQRGCTLCEIEIMRYKTFKSSHFIWNNPYHETKTI